ncbi:MAG: DUF2878 family protein [Pseudomonadota bacterium]|nr:DUF2878 family protein [Pseudomonadota bacterium]
MYKLSTNLRRVAGLAAFKANWLLLVVGQAEWLHWSVAVLALQVLLCLPPAPGPAMRRAIAIAAIAACGIMLDVALSTVGVLRFDAGHVPLPLCLLWFAFSCLLVQFAAVLRRASLRSLCAAGSIAGAAGYGAGALLGAVGFGIAAWQALLLIAIVWCGVLPLARGVLGFADARNEGRKRSQALLMTLVVLAASPGEAAEREDDWRLLGEGRYTFLLQPLYTARLEIRGDTFAFPGTAPFRLTLRYHRAVKPERIIDATRSEWAKQGVTAPQRWFDALHAALPPLARDDELTLQVTSGFRADLLHNGLPIASFDDPEFTRAFAGIWLDENTSAPRLRRQLLGDAS